MTLSTLLYFLGASVALTLAPGPDNTYVVAQGISRGRRAAFVSAMGMCAGVSVHTTAAALGISAALYSSALAFDLLKYAGALYLLYLAVKAVTERGGTSAQPVADSLDCRALFRRGFIMNVVNPKVALFFLAFLPQFVARDTKSIATEMFLLGLVFMLEAVVVLGAIAYLSGSLGAAVLKKPQAARWMGWLSAGVFASLAMRLALARR